MKAVTFPKVTSLSQAFCTARSVTGDLASGMMEEDWNQYPITLNFTSSKRILLFSLSYMTPSLPVISDSAAVLSQPTCFVHTR